MKPTVYIGPTLPNGILKQYTVFRNGMVPRHIQSLYDGNDALRGLVVPVGDMTYAMASMKRRGTLLNLFSKRVLNEIKGE